MPKFFPARPDPEPPVFFEGGDGVRKGWSRPFLDDAEYLTALNKLLIVCSDVLWVRPESQELWLTWRKVHSTKGPWMFGGRQLRGETPREAAVRKLSREVGTDVGPDELSYLATLVWLSEFRQQEPQGAGCHFILFHYCWQPQDELVASKQAKLDPAEYDLEHGIKAYGLADIEALDGKLWPQRQLLIDHWRRCFG